MRRYSPWTAFLIVWVAVSIGLSLTFGVLLAGEGATWPQKFEGLPLILFFVAPIVMLIGIVVGIPSFMILRHFRLNNDVRALAASATVVGLATSLGILLLGSKGLPHGDDAVVFLGLGGGSGLIAGLIWWSVADPRKQFL